MKVYKLLHKIKYYPLFILFFCFIVSCGPKGKFWDPADLRKVPGNAKEKREKNIQEGRGFRLGNVLDKGGSGTFDFATSNQMWRATLELLDFTPLQNVDYSGGIIVTDWFKEQNNQDSIKITVRFLSNEIRADGIKVIIHKKICKKIDDCRIMKIESTLSQEIKLAILKKAAIMADNERERDPDYVLVEPKEK